MSLDIPHRQVSPVCLPRPPPRPPHASAAVRHSPYRIPCRASACTVLARTAALHGLPHDHGAAVLSYRLDVAVINLLFLTSLIVCLVLCIDQSKQVLCPRCFCYCRTSLQGWVPIPRSSSAFGACTSLRLRFTWHRHSVILVSTWTLHTPLSPSNHSPSEWSTTRSGTASLACSAFKYILLLFSRNFLRALRFFLQISLVSISIEKYSGCVLVDVAVQVIGLCPPQSSHDDTVVSIDGFRSDESGASTTRCRNPAAGAAYVPVRLAEFSSFITAC